MKCLNLFCTLILLSSAIYSEAAAQKNKQLTPDPSMSTIARTASWLLINEHYSQRPLDENVSSVLFDDYFKALDPTHIFFTKQDIATFEPYRKILGKQIRSGNVDFAFMVFNTFLKKLDAYEKFTTEYLKTKPELNSNDTYEYNRTKSDWASNPKELKKIWKKKICNDLILMELLDRSKKIEQSNKTVSIQKKIQAKIKVRTELTPAQRTQKRITQALSYYRNMEPMDVLELYISCLSHTYDPHSDYMSPRTEEEFNIGMKLLLVGIGAVLTTEDGYTKIVRVIPNGPADKDKRLKAEDRIIAVAQENKEPVDIMDMPLTKVVNLIRGKENTKVTLTILEASKGASAAPVNITLVRGKVPLKDSEASGKLHKVKTSAGTKRVGVIVLPSFYIDFAAAYKGYEDYKSSTNDVKKLLIELSKEGPLDGLIIDLRSNGGGSLLEAVALTGMFIKDGPVVQVRDQRSCKVDYDQDGGKILYAGPLAVMINRFSASASEIFAGAIMDYKRGVIVGDTQSHGKGSVQALIELDRYTSFLGPKMPTGSMRLTNAKFYRINGASTQIKGVTPDIIFPSFTDVMELGEDKMPHALKWDTITPVEYQIHNPKFSSQIITLKERSAKRMAESKDFQLLNKDIATFRKIRERKKVSLNLEQRWKEYLAEKKLQDEQDKLLRLDREKNEDKNKEKDIYLNETLQIVGDLITIAK